MFHAHPGQVFNQANHAFAAVRVSQRQHVANENVHVPDLARRFAYRRYELEKTARCLVAARSHGGNGRFQSARLGSQRVHIGGAGIGRQCLQLSA